jgi:hypothetical protein
MTSPAPQTAPADAVVTALQAVLTSQHAAVYGLPVVGVNLTDAAQIDQARTTEATHRQTRDAVMAELVGRGATPAAAQVSYRPAVKVTDAASAQRWALQLEQECARAYRYLLATIASTAATTGASSGASSRSTALADLTDAASAALYWRALLTPSTPTEAFPGV